MQTCERENLMVPDAVREQMYWSNLYAACGVSARVSYSEFCKNPWRWLRAYGCGDFGWDNNLPLLPSQERVRAKLDS